MNRRERRAEWLARHRGDAVGAAGRVRPPRPSPDSAAHTDATTPAAHGPVGRLASGRVAAPRPAPASLHLHIEEVVLYGLSLRGRYRFGDALQRELSRLFDERGVPPSLDDARAAERLDAGSFRTQSNPRPQALGAEVARAIYGGLKG